MCTILTDEIFRVTYQDGGWMKLMRQISEGEAPFYYVTESHLNYDSSVDSSSEDLQFIIDYFDRRLRGYGQRLNELPDEEIEVRKTYAHIMNITVDFLDKIKKEKESPSMAKESSAPKSTMEARLTDS